MAEHTKKRPRKLRPVAIVTVPIGTLCINTIGSQVIRVKSRTLAADGSVRYVVVANPKWRGSRVSVPPTYKCYPFRLSKKVKSTASSADKTQHL